MIGHLLNRTPNLWRLVETSDGMGGSTTTWQLQGTVEARFSAPSPSERSAAAQEGVEVDHDVYLLPDVDVQRGDRLVDGGQTLEIVAVTVPSVSGHHQKATAKQEPWDEPTE